MLKIVFCHHLSEYSCKECLVIYYLCTVDIDHEEIIESPDDDAYFKLCCKHIEAWQDDID